MAMDRAESPGWRSGGARETQCHLCGKQFRAQRGLEMHLTTVHAVIRRCEICAAGFRTASELRRHVGAEHQKVYRAEGMGYEKREYKCEHCDRVFLSYRGHKLHVKNVHEDPLEDKTCEICGFQPKNPGALKRHMRQLHGVIEKPQPEPSSETHRRAAQPRPPVVHDEHARDPGGDIDQGASKLVDRRVPTRDASEAHQRSASEFKCGLCATSFETMGGLKLHIAAKHPLEDIIIVDEDTLSHQPVPDAMRGKPSADYTCGLCRAEFADEAGLKAHLQAQHPDDDVIIVDESTLLPPPGGELSADVPGKRPQRGSSSGSADVGGGGRGDSAAAPSNGNAHHDEPRKRPRLGSAAPEAREQA